LTKDALKRNDAQWGSPLSLGIGVSLSSLVEQPSAGAAPSPTANGAATYNHDNNVDNDVNPARMLFDILF